MDVLHDILCTSFDSLASTFKANNNGNKSNMKIKLFAHCCFCNLIVLFTRKVRQQCLPRLYDVSRGHGASNSWSGDRYSHLAFTQTSLNHWMRVFLEVFLPPINHSRIDVILQLFIIYIIKNKQKKHMNNWWCKNHKSILKCTKNISLDGLKMQA